MRREKANEVKPYVQTWGSTVSFLLAENNSSALLLESLEKTLRLLDLQ